MNQEQSGKWPKTQQPMVILTEEDCRLLYEEYEEGGVYIKRVYLQNQGLGGWVPTRTIENSSCEPGWWIIWPQREKMQLG